MILLNHQAARCGILADCGGITGWSVDGQDMLRPAVLDPDGVTDPRLLASFPLVPYSNRIAGGRFSWAGQSHQLRLNLPPEPHAIHGVGFQRAWDITHQCGHTASLGLRHDPDEDWPFAFEARQTFTLEQTRLTLDLVAINRHGAPAPCAFAHHPYFDADGAILEFEAGSFWRNGPVMLPDIRSSVPPAFDFKGGQPVAGRVVDNCYTGWTGEAHIVWQGRPLKLAIRASATLPALVIYIPPGATEFCVEPVANLTDSLNRAGADPALPVLAPGGRFESRIIFDALPR